MSTEIQIQTTQEIIANIPDTLIRNQTALEKISAKTNQLLVRVQEGMDDEVDAVLNDEIIKFKAAAEACKNRRSPAFQAVDEFRKKFTAIEKAIEDSATLLQIERNKWATIKAEEAKAAEAELARKLAIEQEHIRINNEIDMLLNQHVNGYILEAKKYFNSIFETITFETIEKDKAVLTSAVKPYKDEHFMSFNPILSIGVLCVDDINKKITAIKSVSVYNNCNSRVVKELAEFKTELAEKIPSKLNELKAREQANAAKEAADKAAAEATTKAAIKAAAEAQEKAKSESERLAKEEDARKAAEAARLEQERIEFDLKAKKESEAKAAIEQTQSLFDSQIEAAGNQAPDVKEGYEIILLNSAGYLPIINFYFEKEGLKKLPEEIEKKTLKQMVSFAEKAAIKDEKCIIKSQLIEYIPVYKAKAVKA